MENVCKVCNSRIINDQVKIKGGVICKSCYDGLPIGVRNSVDDFTGKQIQQFKKLATPFKNPGKVWKYCGELKLCIDSVVLNGWEYKIKDLRSVKLNFHPKELGKEPYTAIGVISLVLETKSPHFLIEEAFMDGMTKSRYTISGMNISYHYSREIESAVQCVQEAIREGSGIINAAKEEAERIRREEQARKEQQKREEQKKQTQQEREKKNKEQVTPLEAAMKLFDVRQPFTTAEIRRKRNKLITSRHLHPDIGGSCEEFLEVQEAFEILQKFAVD